MGKTHLLFKKEFMGLILTITSIILTIVSLICYIYNPLLNPGAMATLIAPMGAGGLLFYGIRATEGYFTQQQSNTQINQIPNDQSSISIK